MADLPAAFWPPGPVSALRPVERISARLAWLAVGVGPVTDEALRGLSGQVVRFVADDLRRVYVLGEWHEDGLYYDARWPD